ncbi:uncharacterized protein KGF55_004032 [Candida pseudojiufengensis]|uniref:uncharacterized protein n=1 Tax=Candida pseudojiufengensis TaxID=497109 RepID=UPI002224882B|nr:uncharacterized protein KGF55_004032 [Candida pseudojiufengensis]KAI5961409.1 hypothetical protein KGF55_004032 [Candida pseudojiufengensis]
MSLINGVYEYPTWIKDLLNTESVQKVLNDESIISAYWKSVILNPAVDTITLIIFNSPQYQNKLKDPEYIKLLTDENIPAEIRIQKLFRPYSLPKELYKNICQFHLTLEQYDRWLKCIKQVSPINVKETRRTKQRYQWVEIFVCDRAGFRKSVYKTGVPQKNMKPSKTCGCNYRINAKLLKNGFVRVNWQWKHHNHFMFGEIKNSKTKINSESLEISNELLNMGIDDFGLTQSQMKSIKRNEEGAYLVESSQMLRVRHGSVEMNNEANYANNERGTKRCRIDYDHEEGSDTVPSMDTISRKLEEINREFEQLQNKGREIILEKRNDFMRYTNAMISILEESLNYNGELDRGAINNG